MIVFRIAIEYNKKGFSNEAFFILISCLVNVDKRIIFLNKTFSIFDVETHSNQNTLKNTNTRVPIFFH